MLIFIYKFSKGIYFALHMCLTSSACDKNRNCENFLRKRVFQSIDTKVEPINRCISNVPISGIVIIKSTTQNSNNINNGMLRIYHFIFDIKLKLNQMTGTTETSDDEQDKM